MASVFYRTVNVANETSVVRYVNECVRKSVRARVRKGELVSMRALKRVCMRGQICAPVFVCACALYMHNLKAKL